MQAFWTPVLSAQGLRAVRPAFGSANVRETERYPFADSAPLVLPPPPIAWNIAVGAAPGTVEVTINPDQLPFTFVTELDEFNILINGLTELNAVYVDTPEVISRRPSGVQESYQLQLLTSAGETAYSDPILLTPN